MSEIPRDWSPDALLLFVGVFTALSAGTSIFLAGIWSQKMRRRREHFKIWQDRRLKIWQEQQRDSFLRLERTAKKAQSEVNQRSDDNQKNRALLLHIKVDDFRCKGIGDQTANNALRDIERKSRQADSRLTGFNQKEVRFPPTIKRKPKLFFRIKAFLLSRHENQTHSASEQNRASPPRRNVELSQKKEREAIDAAQRIAKSIPAPCE